MKRTQIQLDEEQADRLKRVALQDGRSMADVIRESVDIYLAARGEFDRETMVERALAAVGRFTSRRDLADRHDAHFIEAADDWKSS